VTMTDNVEQVQIDPLSVPAPGGTWRPDATEHSRTVRCDARDVGDTHERVDKLAGCSARTIPRTDKIDRFGKLSADST